ncbi:MAG: DUF5615 family PIN-like protein [Steroidobacteraceae bacterium]|nr:DUF5615 family PIN-like protein [Steroidobacteraceae bacterium]MCW5573658.1 DUF5615 family PIN-like protein [Steroidobacteraceae bacterium]
MKLLIDMNLSPRWLEVLSQAQFDAVHWSDVGAATTPDERIMAYAAENGFVVLTQDLDFSAILAATHGEKPSVVQIRSEDLDPDAIGPQVIAALRQLAEPLEAGALVSVEPQRIRSRLLPLRPKEEPLK